MLPIKIILASLSCLIFPKPHSINTLKYDPLSDCPSQSNLPSLGCTIYPNEVYCC